MLDKVCGLARTLIVVGLSVGLLSLVGCSKETDELAGLVEPGPVGKERYEQLLAAGSGSDLRAETLGRWGGEAVVELERVMNRIASAMTAAESDGSPESWRTSFAAEMERRPADVEGTLERYREESARAEEFVALHQLLTLPDVPLRVVESQNVIIRQSFPLALYSNGQLAVTTSATADPDPAYLANHCEVCIPPLAVHEAYPGHHVSFWHLGRVSTESVASGQRLIPEHNNMFLLEGWALYAEYLMLELGYYETAIETIAALRGLLHRALRAQVDVGLHLETMTAAQAEQLYVDVLLMTEGAARTEVRRHLAQPTSKATYFVGLLQILELRRQVLAGSPEPTLQEFHDTLLPSEDSYPRSARRLFRVELELADKPLSVMIDWDGLLVDLLRQLQLSEAGSLSTAIGS